MAISSNTIPPEELMGSNLQLKSPLELVWLDAEVELGQGRRADARIQLNHRGESKTFIVEYKKFWTAAALKTAMDQVKQYAELSPGDLPMVVVPYLSDDALHLLAEAGVSGLDLVGNGLIEAEGWFILLRGAPNQFRNTQIIKSPYQGKAALVARTLLACPVLPNAESLRTEIRRRGGEVSQPVVSRALKAFREDLIIGSQDRMGLVLLQPEKLLDRLAEQWMGIVERWRKAGNTVLWTGRVTGTPMESLPIIFKQPRIRQHQLVMTGLTSSIQHTHLTLETTQYLYTNAIGTLFDGVQVTETRRFPNLELLFPPDDAVFFDAVTDAAGVRWASALQTYLELVVGDARLQQSAGELRAALLDEVAQRKALLLSQNGAV